jgi:hypothetical protein
MDLQSVALHSAALCISIWLVMTSMGVRKCLGYAVQTDIAILIGVTLLYQGTAHGFFTAAMTGAVMALTQSIARKLLGYKRLIYKNGHFWWITYSPITGKEDKHATLVTNAKTRARNINRTFLKRRGAAMVSSRKT